MAMTRLTHALLVLTLLAYLPLAAWPAAAASPVYVGQIVPLTGPWASGPGTFEQAGARQAVDEINAQGGIHGRPLKLIVVDDHSTIPGTLAAFRQLTTDGRVTAVIGPVISTMIVPLLPAIKQAGLPVIIGGGAAKLTHVSNPWIFRTRPSTIYSSPALASFAVQTLHLTRIALLHATDPSAMGTDAGVRADLKVLGVMPVTDQVIPDKATDLTAQLQAIEASGATVLISAGQPADYVLLGRQMRQMHLHLTWLGDTVLGSPVTRKMGGAFLYGAYSATDYVSGQNAEAVAFEKALKARFQLPGAAEAAYVYDGLHILAMVMRTAGTAPQALRQGILAVQGYHGVEGTYNFDRNGDGLHQDNIVQNVQGRLHLIKVFTF
jgi:branched-chain amino acid transport system substrate-binding protein